MNYFLFCLAILAAFILGAFSHEADIAMSCAKYGHFGHAGWTVDMPCGEGKP